MKKKRERQELTWLWKVIGFLTCTAMAVAVVVPSLKETRAESTLRASYMETEQKAQVREYLYAQRHEERISPPEETEESQPLRPSREECELVATLPDEPHAQLHELMTGQAFDVVLRLPDGFQKSNHYQLNFNYDLETAAEEVAKIAVSLYCEESLVTYFGELRLKAIDDVRLGPALRSEGSKVWLYGYDVTENSVTVRLSTAFVDHPRRLYSEKYLGVWTEITASEENETLFLLMQHDIYPVTEISPLQIKGWCPRCEHDRRHCDCGYFEESEAEASDEQQKGGSG